MDETISLCDVCKRKEAFYFRPYSGMKLCKKCFLESIETKTRAAIASYRMFKFNDKIALAVSGGKDSVSLLHVLTKVERRHPKAKLVAVTVDEGIRGYRDEALKIAAENCEELGVEHLVVSFRELFGSTFDETVKKLKEDPDAKISPCAVCGVLRRKALNLAARNIKADKLATAHTLDDEVQTYLLNILHGDVWRIAKEKPVTNEVHLKLVPRAKPFCEIPEKETALYAYAKGIKFQNSPCPYAMEALRNDARTLLNTFEMKHPGIKFTIFNSIEKIRPALEQTAKLQGLGECAECGEPTTEKVCRTCQLRRQIM